MIIRRSDYHTHTPLCLHAEGEPEAFVERALELGLTEYGIADHAPMPKRIEPFDEWRMREEQLPLYWDWVERARTAAKGTDLRIRVGLECDWIAGMEDWIVELRARYDWDYFIGSIHYLSTESALDDPVFGNRPEQVQQDWDRYWGHVLDMVRSGLFDMYGHIDIMKIWGNYPKEGSLMSYYEPVLDALQEGDSIVELNVAGWHKPCAQQYPSEEMLRELLRRGVPIAVNSDAHMPSQLSRDWERGVELLTQLSPSHSLQQIRHRTGLLSFLSQ